MFNNIMLHIKCWKNIYQLLQTVTGQILKRNNPQCELYVSHGTYHWLIKLTDAVFFSHHRLCHLEL